MAETGAPAPLPPAEAPAPAPALPLVEPRAPAPLLLAESERGTQHRLCATCAAPAALFCAKCRGAPYCGGACQKAHWPAHKPECGGPPQAIPAHVDPIVRTAGLAASLSAAGALPEDWETPYNFIYLAPHTFLFTCPAAAIPAIQGVLDALPALPLGAGRTPADLNARFQWSTTGRRHAVLGYGDEDAVTLQAWAEVSFATATSLRENFLGMQLMLMGDMRGGVLVEKKHLGVKVPLTRREVWEVVTVRGLYSVLGLLTPRQVRDNTRRRESITTMRAMGVVGVVGVGTTP